jgi:integrase/recombinase XerC
LIGELKFQVEPWTRTRDVKPRTRKVYQIGVEKFLNYCDDRGVRIPQETDLISFKEDLQSSGFAVNTINLHMTGTRLFFKSVSVKSGFSQLDIGEGVKGLKGTDEHLRDSFSLEQINVILGSIDRETLTGKRDYAIISCMVYLGLRTIEITRADIQDIRQKKGRDIVMIQGKGRDQKDQMLILRSECKSAIDDYLRTRSGDRKLNPSAPLFVSHSRNNRDGRLSTALIRLMFSGYMKKVGIVNPRLSCHSVRHFICTHLIERGVDIVKVQQFMRHKSINTTLKYYHQVSRFDSPPEDKIDLTEG